MAPSTRRPCRRIEQGISKEQLYCAVEFDELIVFEVWKVLSTRRNLDRISKLQTSNTLLLVTQ